jgi:hypothetical protein
MRKGERDGGTPTPTDEGRAPHECPGGVTFISLHEGAEEGRATGSRTSSSSPPPTPTDEGGAPHESPGGRTSMPLHEGAEQESAAGTRHPPSGRRSDASYDG